MVKFKEWIKETYEPETLADIAEHGCSAGWFGMTYYTETVALYDKHEEEIWDALAKDAEAFGFDNPVALIASFNGAKNANTGDQFKNLLVWWYAERTAYVLDEEYQMLGSSCSLG